MDDLAAEAIGVLCANDRVGWTRPSPRLYPHQWSWDAAFVAMGWAHVDPARAVAELDALFQGQWATGMVPQIVFEGTGLVSIFHPWESGLDNSPRWDAALAAVEPGAVRPAGEMAGGRPDLAHVSDASERPTDDDYHRYHALVRSLVDLDYDQARAHAAYPFRMADVLFTAILAAADDALADLAVLAGRPGRSDGHRVDADRSRAGLDRCWDPARGACLDRDQVTDRPVARDTIAGFAPLIAGCDPARAARLADRLAGPSYTGAGGLRWRVPPTTAVDDPAFDARSYWRGPTWPVVTWLLWWGLERAGHRGQADGLRIAAVDQLRASGCSEYAEPFTGEPLGSRAQSWTAAVALDWLAQDRWAADRSPPVLADRDHDAAADAPSIVA